uniref:Uncharacterized protein n=1 Tax=Hordeum vulgare subsp. vulgare TaxID=112509 RepID=A0A8I6XW46_HORVV
MPEEIIPSFTTLVWNSWLSSQNSGFHMRSWWLNLSFCLLPPAASRAGFWAWLQWEHFHLCLLILESFFPWMP